MPLIIFVIGPEANVLLIEQGRKAKNRRSKKTDFT
jgi:hypothetical protein